MKTIDMQERIRLAADIGGTFTDLIAFDQAAGALKRAKVPSVPGDPSLAVIDEMRPRPVTLRTFDIGGDKFVSTFQVPPEMNPMLEDRHGTLGFDALAPVA